MKKILLNIVVLSLSLILVSCREEKYLDKLIDLNSDYALLEAKTNLLYKSYEVKSTWTTSVWDEYFLLYDNLYDEEEISDMFIEYVDRVVITVFDNNIRMVEVLECYSEEDAINLFEKLDSIQLYRNKNLIYTNTPFAWLLLYGDKVNDGLYEYPILKNTIVSIIEKERNQKKGELTIPNEIESISAGALHSLKYITKIVCGKNLKVIGNNAFSKSNMLEEVFFNEGLQYINYGAFMNDSKLKYVIFPTTLKYIGMYAFFGCNNLEYIIIPNNIKYIGQECFSSGIIYCEAESKPKEWDDNFAEKDVIVYWGNEWEYNEEGIPVPIE